jgi:hypothetical protein
MSDFERYHQGVARQEAGMGGGLKGKSFLIKKGICNH